MTPNAPRGPIAAYRRYWLPELVVLLAMAIAATVLFSATDLDVAASRRFYHPELADHWPVASQPVWRLFYLSTPWITGSLAAVGGALLVAGLVRRRLSRLRLYGLFVLLSVIVGPGLIVNGLLKDHWGRPRPREIVELGGRMEYAPPLLPTGSHGKSFPCGHCSVGYLYAVGWWIWRRSRPRWAAASLGTGLVLGTLLGVGRMAAGGHFLSDAVWAGLISFSAAHVFYYYGLRVPAREDCYSLAHVPVKRRPHLSAVAIAAAIVLVAAVIGGGVLASWRYADLTARVPLRSLPKAPEIVEVVADTLDVEIHLIREPATEIECAGDVHGFGLPTGDIRAGWTFEDRPIPTLCYRVAEKGWYLYIDAVARIRLPWRTLRMVSVRTQHGNISVIDETGGAFAEGPHPTFDLHSADGRANGPQGAAMTNQR
jgi:membrane-associated PAP2 superfamily phosphatase